MPTVKLSPLFNGQAVKSTGVPASGHKINTYAAGSSSALATYTDSTGNTAQANPIVLNSNGLPDNEIWLQSGLAYKFVWTDENDAVINTFDNISGINDTSTSVTQWQASGVTPTYVSATSFTLSGDQTTEFHVGRRLQCTVSAGTVDGVIATSAYASLTTVTVVLDSGSLDSGLSTINLSILRADHPALPTPVATFRQIQPITASVSGNALTTTLNATSLDFRSSSIDSGVVNNRTVLAPISLTVPSGAQLGVVSGFASRLAVLAIDNAGTVELAITNLSGGVNLDEATLISTTAISSSSNSASGIYSTSARTSVPFRVVGFLDVTEVVTGTWATAPSTIQGAGGQAMTALNSFGFGQSLRDFTGSRAVGTTYYNTTGKPITIYACGTITGTGNGIYISTNGLNIRGSNNGAGGGIIAAVQAVIPPGRSYSVNADATLTLVSWYELR